MMTTLGNKKNVKIFSFALAGVFIASVAAMAVVSMGDTANAAPTSDIGVVDQREVISSNGTLAMDYQQKLKSTADEMQKDFDAKSAGMSDAEKEKLLMTCSSSSIRREHPSKRIWKTRLQAQSSLWLPKRDYPWSLINPQSFTAVLISLRK